MGKKVGYQGLSWWISFVVHIIHWVEFSELVSCKRLALHNNFP